MPVAGYPALTDVGAWRGHGLPIPPLLGSGAEPYGGWPTTRRQIAGVGRRAAGARDRRGARGRPARALLRRARGAARAARSRRRESGAVSVQHFVDNVLNPGVAGDVAVPRGGVRRAGRPVPVAVAAPRRRRGAATGRGGARRRPSAAPPSGGSTGPTPSPPRFVRDVVDLVRARPDARSACGRRPPSRARCAPGDGYVVGWKSADDARRLAGLGLRRRRRAGAEAYYLDMAADADWWSPGTSWAGHSLARRRRARSTSPPAGRRRSAPACSASRPACGPSTSTTDRRSRACCSLDWRPSPTRRGP